MHGVVEVAGVQGHSRRRRVGRACAARCASVRRARAGVRGCARVGVRGEQRVRTGSGWSASWRPWRGGVVGREGRGRPEREQGVRGGAGCGSGASGSEAEEGERKEGERKEKGKGEKGKRNGKKEKEIEKKNGREGKEKEGAGFVAAGHDASRWMGKEMGRGLNSGVGLFRRGSGN